MYILQSKVDNQNFEVNQKVIDSSVLLKNICDLTETKELIVLNCSSQFLEIFIKLIDYYEIISEQHDFKFEKDLFKNFDDKSLAEFVNEMVILDTDFLFDSIADLILDRIKNFDVREIQGYLCLEDDFTPKERKLVNQRFLEYIISINIENSKLNFPFSAINFLSLKNKFYCSFNVLLSRIIQRSNEITALKLSLINKMLKNEVDRHPIKLSHFCGNSSWLLQIDYPNAKFLLSPEIYNENYFNAIKKRKILVGKKIEMYYESRRVPPDEGVTLCSSLDFAIPSDKMEKKLEVEFQGNETQIFFFNVYQCPFPSLIYTFKEIKVDFEKVYQELIAKDFSKKIKICNYSEFNFFYLETMIIEKRANENKFHKIDIISFDGAFTSKFKYFIFNYMADDGFIKCSKKIFNIQNTDNRQLRKHLYPVSEIKDYLQSKKINN